MGKILYKAIIPIRPITKKNHQEIRVNPKTKKRYISQSERYIQYESDAGWFLKGEPMINIPVNIQMIFYMPTKGRIDLSNLQSACLDILVAHHIIEDDNSKIVATHDGSCVKYDKENPRTEIIITRKENENN